MFRSSRTNLAVLARSFSNDIKITVDHPHVGHDSYQSLYKESIDNFDDFWRRQAEELTWERKFHTVSAHDKSEGLISFFTGGKINASENCIDRHLHEKADQTALIWEADEPGEGHNVSYLQLHHEVCRLANLLKAQGVRKGDRVCIYMPMTPYVVYAMQACARIGAVHTVVFAGFSAEALASRITDAECKVLITADEGVRGGKIIPLRQTCQEALDMCPPGLVKSVLVQRRTGNDDVMQEGDINLQEAMALERPYCAPVHVDSEDPLFILYTSGSTGKPKGLVHTTGGYLSHTSATHKHIFDMQDGDVWGCVADVGWITGHSYIVYGPLLNGACSMVFESLPHYPDAGRYWDIVQKHKVTQLYTAPTAIRLLMKHDNAFVTKYDRSSLRVLGSVGEPINPDAWQWYNDVVGEGRCSIVDTWWQTETGGIMMTPLPGETGHKPGAATRPFYGVEPVLLDNDGNELDGNDVSGILAIRNPMPGMARTILGDHGRFNDVYWRFLKPGPTGNYYFTGDGARRDADGHYWITGRVDDVINVSGHRIGTAEIESAIIDNHEAAVEAAVVGFPHEIKGQGIYAYVTFKEDYDATGVEVQLKQIVRKAVGPFAQPDVIHVTGGLPKTRSGKIMRRILRKVANNEFDELGDLSTLNEPQVVDEIIAAHKALTC